MRCANGEVQDAACAVAWGASVHLTLSATSPRSVNLIALRRDSRAPGAAAGVSPQRGGTSWSIEHLRLQALGSRAGAHELDHFLDRSADLEIDHVELHLAGIDLGEIENVSMMWSSASPE